MNRSIWDKCLGNNIIMLNICIMGSTKTFSPWISMYFVSWLCVCMCMEKQINSLAWPKTQFSDSDKSKYVCT